MHIYHGTIVCCDTSDQVATYLIENNGKIAFVGDEIPAEYQKFPVLELGQKAIVPAFADTHVHFASWAFFAQQLYIGKVR
jgi:hypothetical protein